METKKLTIKNETEVLRDAVYGMMKQIQEKLEQGYSITSIYKTYDKDDDFPYNIELEFDKDDDE